MGLFCECLDSAIAWLPYVFVAYVYVFWGYDTSPIFYKPPCSRLINANVHLYVHC